MAEPYFVWNSIDSRTYYVVVTDYPPIIRPKERVTEVVVPGRAGSLHITEGTDVYEPYLRSCQCYAKPAAAIDTLVAWLRGSGTVVFGNEPTRSYNARIDNQISYDKIMRGRDYKSFVVPFLCEPYKYLYPAAADIVKTVSGQSVTNPGTASSEPIIKVEGTGDIALLVGSYTIELSDIDTGIIIDSEMQDVYNLTATELLNEQMSGVFPRLVPGANAISWTGTVTKVTITPKWRYL